MKMLSQEYILSSYFFKNNIFIIIFFILMVALPILLMSVSFFSIKTYKILATLILGSVLLGLLYPILLPYNYGKFTDNHFLTPEKSLHGFTRWYYLFDFLLIVGVAYLSRQIVKSKQTKTISLFVILFYVVEFTSTLSSIKVDPSTSLEAKPFVFSKNRPNVLVFILDAVPALVMEDYINNFLSPQESSWKKDFTFFNNVSILGLGGTVISLPTIFGGYEFSSQIQASRALQQDPLILEANKQKQYIHESVFSDLAFKDVQARVADFANLSYHFIRNLKINHNDKENFRFHQKAKPSPIFFVPLYARIPYFLRHYITLPYSWNWSMTHRWIREAPTGNFLAEDTDKGSLYVIHNNGTHWPLSSPKYPKGIGTPDFNENIRDITLNSFYDTSQALPDIFDKLKTMGVYDNTKIILTADHGFRGVKDYEAISTYFKSITSNNLAYTFMKESEYINIMQIPGFILIKDLNARSSSMKVDERFLSLGDISPMILSTYNVSKKNHPDYTKVMPPKRMFNLPIFGYEVVQESVAGLPIKAYTRRFFKEFATNHMWPYVQVKGITSGEFEIKYWPVDKIGDLPAQEIITK
ncbi:MAG: sulfatase-like hydrolase/transferase [Brevinema sp.]